MDGLAALGCCFPAEMSHLSLCHLAKSSGAGKDSAVLPARCFSSGYRWRGIDYSTQCLASFLHQARSVRQGC